MTAVPCPCCGHRTLPEGPGDYELCPVCFWEDDGGQLRYPLSGDGANGISLAEAQERYARLGAMSQSFVSKVRRARDDEPLDEGWRPFDPARDWTAPALDSDIWPVNPDSLYYWRPTYWNGDQHRLPLPPREPTDDDRLLAHLRREVPEIEPAVAESIRRWGAASAFGLCHDAAVIALAAYRAGDAELGLRVATALLPALDDESPLYAPNCIHIAFLEHEGWDDPAIQHHLDAWPAPVRDVLRRQQEHQRELEAANRLQRERLAELYRTGRGQPVASIVEQLRDLRATEYEDRRTELHRELFARVISDPRWLYRHPLDSALVAWRYRDVQRPRRSLAWLRRPRFAG
jgi:hypothetical protein